MECLFCKIISNELPSYKLYEDKYTCVFLDIKPDYNGHLLVLPKKHIVDISDINAKDMGHLLDTMQHMKKILEKKLKVDGVTIVLNNGLHQDIKHFHFHMKPAYKVKQELRDVKEIYDILK